MLQPSGNITLNLFISSRALSYASEAAMPFYLLHMTFSTLAGYFIIQLKVPVTVKYPLTVLLASGLTLAAYELLVRRFNIMRYLLEMKLKKRDVPVSLDAKLEGQRF
jgi:hypothetical protein